MLEVFEVESFQMVPKLHRSILAYLIFLEGTSGDTVGFDFEAEQHHPN